MLHVAHVSFFLDPRGREPEQLLDDWPSLVDVAEAASAAGVRVSVIQACSRQRTLTRNGVDYHFLAPDEVVPTIVCSDAFDALVRNLGDEPMQLAVQVELVRDVHPERLEPAVHVVESDAGHPARDTVEDA